MLGNRRLIQANGNSKIWKKKKKPARYQNAAPVATRRSRATREGAEVRSGFRGQMAATETYTPKSDGFDDPTAGCGTWEKGGIRGVLI